MTKGPLTAVLADDVADLRQLYRMILERSGHFRVVAEAGDGATAVELAGEHRPELLLLDVSMPVLDGLEALPRILAVSPTTRVVMLTGFSAARLGPVALQRGAIGYLEKGLTPQQLIAELLTLLGETDAAADVAVAATPLPAAPAQPEPSLDATVLSVVAHEIRNPLSVVQGFASILEQGWGDIDPHEARHLVGRISSNTRYVDGVVRSILTLSSLESGEALLDVTERDPVALVEKLLAPIRDEHPGREILFRVEDRPRPARVDEERFRQVLANLVGNADRYAPAGTPVTVTVRPDAGTAAICVADEGPGIPPESRDQVFERFVRLHRGGNGIGLGLYISRLLMTAMGGDIGIADSDRGTHICCRLATATGDA